MTNQVCFDHNHMTPSEFGLYCYARAVSHESGVFYTDGRAIAKQFVGTSKSAIYRLADSLCDKGWFQLIVKKARNKKTGVYAAARYTVLDHDTWAAIHKGECQSSPESGTGSSPTNGTGLTSPKPESSSPISVHHLSHSDASPVPPAGHSIVKRDLKRENGKESTELAHSSFDSKPSPAATPSAAAKTVEERIRAMDAKGHDNETIAARFGITEVDVVRILNTPIVAAAGAQQ